MKTHNVVMKMRGYHKTQVQEIKDLIKKLEAKKIQVQKNLDNIEDQIDELQMALSILNDDKNVNN